MQHCYFFLNKTFKSYTWLQNSISSKLSKNLCLYNIHLRYVMPKIEHYAPRTQVYHSRRHATRTRGNVTLCVRGSMYYFFVGRPQNEFSRPVWKSWNSKFITLFYIVYFAVSIRAVKIHFAAWGQKSYL